jgi:predicted site-specific integrase-resolvase
VKYSNGKIIILEKSIQKEVKEELVDDVLQIMNVFVAKINEMRKYSKNKIIENENIL